MWSGFALVFFYVLRNNILVVVWCISIISHRPHNEFCRKCVMKNGYMCNSDFSKFYHQNDHKKGCENCTKTAAFTGICVWLFATKLDRFFPKRESSWEILLSQVSINKARGAQCHIMIKFFWFGRSNCIDTLRLFVWKIV